MFTPRKCGVKFDPPTLVLYYEANLTGKLHKRSMPIRMLRKDSSCTSKMTVCHECVLSCLIISDAVEELRKSSRHGKYLEKISVSQLEKLLTMIQKKMKGLDPLDSRDIAASVNSGHSEEDFNKLDDYELDKRKADMDKEFEMNRIRPGDKDFVYDKEVEFNGGKIESGWDEEDDYSDPDF
ncbi:centrosomal protein of 19 kDa-like isoform X1 [Montipora capricornis]|uniref:centrosomal protein of 19 kDa-like isoform X1 n=1 Tax=Montipora capricornis TaxID=246305 RepID=UPI0035F1BAF0